MKPKPKNLMWGVVDAKGRCYEARDTRDLAQRWCAVVNCPSFAPRGFNPPFHVRRVRVVVK